jgi:succinate dehydrogenase / fumarate reductase flavoprotein subunit
VPRDVASRAAKERCDAGYGVNNTGRAVYLDFKEAIQRLGKQAVEEKYGNLFEMYERIVDENPYVTPMMIYPAVHYTMGGLWVDYELQTTVKGLFAAGEANFSDHGANRLGASALMQGLSDGYFVLPYTMQNYLADQINEKPLATNLPQFEEAENAVRQRITRILSINGDIVTDNIHRRLGRIMWEKVGMSRTEQSLKEAIEEIKELRNEFWTRVKVPNVEGMNTELEKALRVADFLEMGELIARDALMRNESCGGHFREEYQTPDGEAQRDDEHYAFVAAYEYQGVDNEPILHKEELKFENVELKQRNYK